MTIREVKKIVEGRHTVDGAGVKLIRVLGYNDVKDIDPFLMLDNFSSRNPEDYIKGFPMHPHRGIETITYLIDGEVKHRDSLGHSESLYGGQVQWMNSGSGIIHEEMPQPTENLWGLQFWLNLPAHEKMSDPEYFTISSDMMKEIPLENGHVRLISGEFEGVKAIDPRHVKATMMDISLDANATRTISIPQEQNTFLYIIEGEGFFGAQETVGKLHSAVIFDKGDTLKIKAGAHGLRFVLLYGKPLNEPIYWGGPIVMNSEEDLNFAFTELERGTFIKHKR